MITVRLNTQPARMAVLARCSPSSFATGVLNMIEVPKSPWTKRQTHET